MSLFSNIKDFVTQNVSDTTKKKVVSVIDSALTVLTSPIGAIKNFKKAKEVTSKTSTLSLVAQGVENTLLAVAPFSAAGKSLATKAVSKAFGTVGSSATTLLVGGAAVSSPTIRNAAVNLLTPSNLIASGEKIGKYVEDIPDKVKDSGIVGGVLAAGAGLGLTGLAVAGAKLLYDDYKDGGIIDTLPTETGESSIIATNPSVPMGQETSTISVGKRKYKKSKKQQQPQNISQKVNIMINNSNKSQTKKYLNRLSY